jgi:hypothetical protein
VCARVLRVRSVRWSTTLHQYVRSSLRGATVPLRPRVARLSLSPGPPPPTPTPLSLFLSLLSLSLSVSLSLSLSLFLSLSRFLETWRWTMPIMRLVPSGISDRAWLTCSIKLKQLQ